MFYLRGGKSVDGSIAAVLSCFKGGFALQPAEVIRRRVRLLGFAGAASAVAAVVISAIGRNEFGADGVMTSAVPSTFPAVFAQDMLLRARFCACSE